MNLHENRTYEVWHCTTAPRTGAITDKTRLITTGRPAEIFDAAYRAAADIPAWELRCQAIAVFDGNRPVRVLD